jgi:opacity protein-like surface antigen
LKHRILASFAAFALSASAAHAAVQADGPPPLQTPPAPVMPAYGYVPALTPPEDAAARPLYLQAHSTADAWQLSLAIPVWLPALDGDLVVRGREASPSQGTGDVFDSHVNAAFVVHFEAEKARFGFLLDAMYLDLRAENGGRDTDNEASLKGFIGEAAVFYAIVAPEPGRRGWGTFRLDALGGVRVTDLELGLNGSNFGVSASRTIYDPMVGLRMELGLTDWLSLTARGDIGGFGITAWPTSDLSYNIVAGLEFHVATWFDVGVGYRWLDYDFASKSGSSSFDATLQGPYLALRFNF